MITSLAGSGAALGTCGLPESALAGLCAEAGFASVSRMPSTTLFDDLYVVRR